MKTVTVPLDSLDFAALSAELVRAVRGPRPQVGTSRKLGFSTNVIYTWESGRCQPSASQFLRLAEKCRVDVRDALRRFYPRPPTWLSTTRTVATRAAVAAFLRDHRGSQSLVELAERTGVSRFALSRWFKGTAEPRFDVFLVVVEAMTQRVLELAAVFAEPSRLPSIEQAWLQHQAALRASNELPWTQGVLRVLELAEYRRLERHEGGWIARRLRIDQQQVVQALEVLESSGQIERRDDRYGVVGSATLNLRSRNADEQRAFWAKVAAERVGVGKGMFAYNVCSISSRDLQRIKALQRDFLQQARSIIATSTPQEHVALIQIQILALDAFHEEG